MSNAEKMVLQQALEALGEIGKQDHLADYALVERAKSDIRLALVQNHQGEPVSCSHEWTDDGEFMLVCTVCGAQENHDPKWRDMATAPRDGTLVRLLVEFTEHATEDSEAMPSPTIGANSFDHTGEDLWQFAGWSWEQDCFTQGEGEPVGWLPMLDTPHADPAEIESIKADKQAYAQNAIDLRGEVERLRQRMLACEEIAENNAKACAEALTKLAEAHALLREVDTSGPIGPYPSSLQARIKSALSASAESSAPVEIDERAEFDAWFKDHSKNWPFPSESIKCIARDNDWLVWQARAALERK